MPDAKLEASYSFPVELFHPLPYAGLSRRSARHYPALSGAVISIWVDAYRLGGAQIPELTTFQNSRQLHGNTALVTNRNDAVHASE